MGIKGLLQELKGCTEHCHISQFKGKKIAVDGFVWLHKASYFCAKDLFLNPGTKKIMPYLVRKLKILLDNEIQPFFVFDGRSLPIKANVNDVRRQIRQQAKEKIIKFTQEGREDQITSTDYNSAVSIKHETIKTFIRFLRKSKISYIVAPYEADAQLAYLARANYVDLVLTEDSDLIAYGTSQVLFKLNFDGYVDSIKLTDAIAYFQFNPPNNNATRHAFNQSKKCSKSVHSLIPNSTDFPTFTQIKEISEKDYDDFLTFCILSGCDYAPHIKYVGPKAAISLVLENHSSIDAILKQLSLKKRVIVPPNYKQAFQRAKLTFMHQKVYNIDLKQIVPLAPFNLNKSDIKPFDDFDFEFTGKIFKGKELSLHIKGEIDSHHNDENNGEEEEEENDDSEGQNLTSDEEEEKFDDRDMNEYFIAFTKSLKYRSKSENVIQSYSLYQQRNQIDHKIHHDEIKPDIDEKNDEEEEEKESRKIHHNVKITDVDEKNDEEEEEKESRKIHHNVKITDIDEKNDEEEEEKESKKNHHNVKITDVDEKNDEEEEEKESRKIHHNEKITDNDEINKFTKYRFKSPKSEVHLLKDTQNISDIIERGIEASDTNNETRTGPKKCKTAPFIEVYMSHRLFDDDDDDDDNDNDNDNDNQELNETEKNEKDQDENYLNPSTDDHIKFDLHPPIGTIMHPIFNPYMNDVEKDKPTIEKNSLQPSKRSYSMSDSYFDAYHFYDQDYLF